MVLVFLTGGEGRHPASSWFDSPVELVVVVDKDKVATAEVDILVGQVEQGGVVEVGVGLLI